MRFKQILHPAWSESTRNRLTDSHSFKGNIMSPLQRILDDLVAHVVLGHAKVSPPSFHCSYKLETFRETPSGYVSTGATGFTDNMVLDQGLEQLAVGGAATTARVGASGQVPAATDTALVSPIATTTSIQSTSESAAATAPYYGEWVVVFRYGAGVAEGNIAEQGLGSTSVLVSRSLVLDDVTQLPIVKPVAADEFLDQTVRIRNYPPTTDATTTVVLNGITHTVTARAANVTSATHWSPKRLFESGAGLHPVYSTTSVTAYNGSINAAVTGIPSGSSDTATIMSNRAYVAGTHERAMRGYFGLDDGNLAGYIKSFLVLTAMGAVQLEFSPVIQKTNTYILDLDFTVGWTRYGS